MPLIASKGIELYCEVIGSGSPLFLHHGTTGSGESWKIDGYIDALKEHYQVILFDGRGHGRSSKPHEPDQYTDELLASDVVAVIDYLEIQKINFWGYSWGARVGYALAATKPERFNSLILGGGNPFESNRYNTINRSNDPAQARHEILSFFGLTEDTIPEKYGKLFLSNDFLAIQSTFIDKPSLASELNGVTVPTLIYAGTDDPACKAGHDISNIMSCSTIFDLEGLSHLQALMAANKILPKALEFLRTC